MLIGGFDEEHVRKTLVIPKHYKIVALLSLGLSSESLDVGRILLKIVRKSKKINEIVKS